MSQRDTDLNLATLAVFMLVPLFRLRGLPAAFNFDELILSKGDLRFRDGLLPALAASNFLDRVEWLFGPEIFFAESSCRDSTTDSKLPLLFAAFLAGIFKDGDGRDPVEEAGEGA